MMIDDVKELLHVKVKTAAGVEHTVKVQKNWHGASLVVMQLTQENLLLLQEEPEELLEDFVPVQTHPNVHYMKTWRAAQGKYTMDGKKITKRQQLDPNCKTKEEIQESFAKLSLVLQVVYDTYNDGPDEESEE